ncbi:MAG: nucleotide exchange factor GrpE [Alphaproteobacteria bacterium]|nr:nucleotide exchange factor GrpE [Alphaproteobacteria bacterium]
MPISPAVDRPEAANEASGEPGVAAEIAVAERLAALEQQVAELKDAHLRALAEGENIRRRGQRERDEAVRYGAAGLGRDLLPVADNLRRAIDALPLEARQGEGPLANLAAGVEMVERELLKAFETHRIQRIDPKGEKFDHGRHQALFEVDAAAVPPGHVAEVLQVGYVLHDRLLRPAMVGVAKTGPADMVHVDTVV